jgi:hypothetical protein
MACPSPARAAKSRSVKVIKGDQGDQGFVAIDNLGSPIHYRHPNEKSATGNNEQEVR